MKINLGRLTFEGHVSLDQGSHQNGWIIEPIGAFFVCTINNQVIHRPLYSLNVLQGLNFFKYFLVNFSFEEK